MSAITEPARILVIDDDTHVLKTYARLFRRWGHVVDTAVTAQEGLEYVGRADYDAIFSDIVMPGLTGIDLLGAVRSLDLDVPVMLMTGNPQLETAIRAIESGVARYLVKPVSNEVLRESVAWAVRIRALARARRAVEASCASEPLVAAPSALEVRFDRALGQLRVVFQPILSSGGAIYGYEALMRTSEPSFPTPPDLLEAAERLGRLPDVGGAVRRAVAAAAPEAPDGAFLFVNLHPSDLLDPSLYDADAPLAKLSSRVVFELTERAPLDDIGDVVERRQRLRELGYRIAIDDLGAGYAGISSLLLLDPEIVKLDMSLVRGIDAHPARQTVVGALARLVRDLGMLVVAEGVETTGERDTLLALGCELLQGYLFGRPVPGFSR